VILAKLVPPISRRWRGRTAGNRRRLRPASLGGTLGQPTSEPGRLDLVCAGAVVPGPDSPPARSGAPRGARPPAESGLPAVLPAPGSSPGQGLSPGQGESSSSSGPGGPAGGRSVACRPVGAAAVADRSASIPSILPAVPASAA